MSSLVKAERVTATGDIGVGPARLLNVRAVSDGVAEGRVTITDGVGGDVVLDFDVVSGNDCDFTLPWDGIRCANSVVVSTLTNVISLTIVYG